MEAPMNGSVGNTVRAPGAPIARRRTGRKGSDNRDSSALRASVLDVAMQIGLGIDGAVTDWVYNNSVNEEEEEPTPSPGLTFGSSAASEDWSSTSSARFPYSPPSSSRSIASSTRSVFSPQKLFAPGALAIPEEPPVPDTNSEEGARSDHAANVPTPTSATSPDAFAMPLPSIRISTKLKKRRGDGYESDAGYVSDAKGKKKDKKKNSGSSLGRKVGENDEAEVKDEEAQREPTKNKESERQRARSFTSQGTGVDAKTSESLVSKGYETDAPIRKSRFGRKKKLNAGYETDASNISSPSPGPKKSRKFFRLGGKSSKSELVATASKNWPPFIIGQKSEKGLHPNAATQLPALPPLPSLDTSFADSLSIQDYMPPTSPASSPVSAPPAILTTPIPPAKSGDLTKGPSSKKQVRDSHVSGESSRSSASNASSTAGREVRSPKHKGLRFFSSSKSSSPGKFPVISLPLGRPISPYSEVNTDSIQQDQDRSEFLQPDSLRSPSSPSKSGSSAQEIRRQYTSPPLSAVSSPTPPQCPVLPALLPSGSPSLVISTSEPSSTSVSRNRLRSSQLTVATNLGIMPSLTRLPSKRISQSPVPSSEWAVHPPATNGITPSSASNGILALPNPNTLSYYDIPPPSPPPNVPLPKVPDVVQSAAEDDPFGVNGTSVIPSLCLSNRGSKDIPFLARLRARAGSHNSAKNHDTTKGIIRAIKQQISEPLSIAIETDHQRQSYSSKGQETDGDDIDGQIQDVLDRFANTANNQDGHEVDGRALGRSRSFEALNNELSSVPVASSEGGEAYVDEDESFYSREFSRKRRSTLYYSDQDEDGVDPRLSRWSGSVYSRTSILDSQKSEETRTRFVKRVEAMLDEAGIERGNKRDWDAVPPVPKLPESLARSNILTRRNQLKSIGTGDSSWIQF